VLVVIGGVVVEQTSTECLCEECVHVERSCGVVGDFFCQFCLELRITESCNLNLKTL
jgi:hypothetical protein